MDNKNFIPPFSILSLAAILVGSQDHRTQFLKIEISSNGQNCSILSRNVPKFELYKHNPYIYQSILTKN
jgi:hypothetical protein